MGLLGSEKVMNGLILIVEKSKRGEGFSFVQPVHVKGTTGEGKRRTIETDGCNESVAPLPAALCLS